MLISAAGGVLALTAAPLPLPGLDHGVLEQLKRIASEPPAFASALTLGLVLALAAFLLVELAALVLPRWRGLRTGGPAARAKLGIATVRWTAVLALLQAVVLAVWREGPVPVTSDWLTITCLAAAGVLLPALALLIGRFGLGNGFAVLLLVGLASRGVSAVTHSAWTAGQTLGLFGAGWAVVLATTWILRRRVDSDSPATRIRLPTAGVLPLVIVVVPSLVQAGGAAALGSVALLSLALSWLMSRPSRVGATVSRGDRAAQHRILRTFAASVGLSTVDVVALAGCDLVAAGALGAAGLALATATVMDLVAEWRARWRRDDLVPVWPMHRIQRLDLVGDALARSGIDAHARGAYLRSLLHFFGPFVPVVLMVPEAQVHEARAVIRTQLGLARPIQADSECAAEPAAPVT